MIVEARDALEALLSSTGLHVYDVVPDRAVVPCAVLEPSSTWVAAGETYAEFRVSFDVTVAVQTGSNQAMTAALDTLVEELLAVIYSSSGFFITDIAAPGGVEMNGVTYLGTTFTVSQNARL